MNSEIQSSPVAVSPVQPKSWQMQYMGKMYNVAAMQDGGVVLQHTGNPDWFQRTAFIREIKPGMLDVSFKRIAIGDKVAYVEISGDTMLKIYQPLEGVPTPTAGAIKVFHNGEYFFLRG
jgi:hypothetical protein